MDTNRMSNGTELLHIIGSSQPQKDYLELAFLNEENMEENAEDSQKY